MHKGDGSAEAWVSTFTPAICQELPQGQFILSHLGWRQMVRRQGGAYVTTNKNVGPLIDFHNIQFYNQANSDTGAVFYTDRMALLEIPNSSFDLNKLVIGKPGTPASATSGGFIDPATIGTCVDLATKQGWKGGIMSFKLPETNATFIKAAKGSSFQ